MGLYQLKVVTARDFNREKAVRHFLNLDHARHAFAKAIQHGKRDPYIKGSGALETFRRAVREHKSAFRDCFENQYTFRIVSRVVQGREFRREVWTGDSLPEALQAIKREIQEHRREIRRYCGFRLPNYIEGHRDSHYGTPNRVINRHYRKRLSEHKNPKDNAEYVGIEIECVTPRGADLSKLYPFHQWLNVGSDGSIEYGNNEEGTEIRVCLRRDEVREVVPKIAEALRSIGAYVNKTCGLHVHLDQRNATNVELNYQKLVRAQGLLYTIVPKSRRDNSYCRRTRQYDFSVARNSNRYHAINADAYNRYRTLEVRLFGGTLDGSKIVNWIETLYGIVEGAPSLRCPKNFDVARRYWKLSDENVAWLKERAAKFADLNVAPVAESDNAEPQRVQPPNNVNTESAPRIRRRGIASRSAAWAQATAREGAQPVLSADSVRRAVNQLREAAIPPSDTIAYVDPANVTYDTEIHVEAGSIFHQFYDNVIRDAEQAQRHVVENALFQGEVGQIYGVTFDEAPQSNDNQGGENNV